MGNFAVESKKLEIGRQRPLPKYPDATTQVPYNQHLGRWYWRGTADGSGLETTFNEIFQNGGTQGTPANR